MKQVALPIILSTAYLLIYLVLALNHQVNWVALLFGFSPIVVIFLVIRVLKDGQYPSEAKTFDESFYENY